MATRPRLTLPIVALLLTHLTLPALAQDSKIQSAQEAKLSDDEAAKQAEIAKEAESEKLTPEEQEKLKQQQEEDAKRKQEEQAKLTPEEQEKLKQQQEEEKKKQEEAAAQEKDDVCGGGGDPHFIGLDGSAYEFHGVSGLNFMLVTEPESQLNAQFHNLGMHADNTYIKALGFVHAPSGHRVTVDSTIEDCSAGVPAGHALAIKVNGQSLDTTRQTTINRPILNATLLKLLKDKDVVVDYRAIRDTDGGHLAEHVVIRTGRLMYTIHRNAGACHLDMDMAVLDAQLLGSTTMHGVLGQTARWASSSDARQVVQGDESEYIESSLTSNDSKFSVIVHKQRAARGRSLIHTPLTADGGTLLATSHVYASCYY